MKETIKNIIKFSIFLSIGLFLFWMVYKDADPHKIMISLSKANYLWIAIALFLGILSHIVRAVRWNMLIQPLGYRPSKVNAFLAVMVMYLANLAIPRLGEISRCIVIKKYENVPLTQAIGTVVVERMVDMMVIFIITILTFAFQMDVIFGFLKNNPSVYNKMSSISTSPLTFVIIGLLLIGFAMIWIFFKSKLVNTWLYKKIYDLVKNLFDGIKTIRSLEKPWLFFAYTLLMWTFYFFMFYLCFFAFDFTSDLSVLIGLNVFIMSSYGMVAPVQGGIGAWHFMTIGTLFLFGVTKENGEVFALVVHETQMLLLIVGGFLALIALPIVNRKKESIS